MASFVFDSYAKAYKGLTCGQSNVDLPPMVVQVTQ